MAQMAKRGEHEEATLTNKAGSKDPGSGVAAVGIVRGGVRVHGPGCGCGSPVGGHRVPLHRVGVVYEVARLSAADSGWPGNRHRGPGRPAGTAVDRWGPGGRRVPDFVPGGLLQKRHQRYASLADFRPGHQPGPGRGGRRAEAPCGFLDGPGGRGHLRGTAGSDRAHHPHLRPGPIRGFCPGVFSGGGDCARPPGPPGRRRASVWTSSPAWTPPPATTPTALC